MKHITSSIIVFIFILAAVVIPGYTETTADAATGLKGYGVYIGQDSFTKLKKKAAGKKTIVIEGQSFTKRQS